MRIKKMFFAFSLCLKLIFDFKTVEKKKETFSTSGIFVLLLEEKVFPFSLFLFLQCFQFRNFSSDFGRIFSQNFQFFRFRFFSSEVDFLRSDFVFKLPDLLDFDSFFLKWIFFNRILS